MPKAIQPLTLSDTEQTELRMIVNQGMRSARTIKRAKFYCTAMLVRSQQTLLTGWTLLLAPFTTLANATGAKGYLAPCTRSHGLASPSSSICGKKLQSRFWPGSLSVSIV